MVVFGVWFFFIVLGEKYLLLILEEIFIFMCDNVDQIVANDSGGI